MTDTDKSVFATKPWLAHYDPGTPEHIEYEKKFLFDFLERSAFDFPDNPALIFSGYKIAYKELNDMVNRFAVFLQSIGIEKGDAVAILLPNTIPCVAAYYAILKVGAIAVMNNPMYSDRELEHQLNDSGSKVVVTYDLLANRMIELRPKTEIKEIVYITFGDYLPFFKKIMFPFVAKKKELTADVEKAENIYKWTNVLKLINTGNPKKVELSFDDIAMYQYTGGTTGLSKGAQLTHGNVSKNIQQLNAWFCEFGRGNHIMLGALPFFHTFGLTCSMNFSIYMGWTNVLVPKPQPDALLEAITRFRPTFAPLVPTMYIGLLEHPDIEKADLSSIKACFSGSASLPLNVIEKFEKKTGSIILEGYGLTESTPVATINPTNKNIRKTGSIGLPASDTLIRIVDIKDGKRDAKTGEKGELIIKGPQIMKGYLNRPKETEEALKDGWLYTGDIAAMDENGFIYIVGRKKNMIISGGFNVYPREIEELYFGHSKVNEAAVVGIPHHTRGEAVKLYLVLKQGETSDSKEMLEYCKGKLAKYKWPIEVEFVKELPKTPVGKVLKHQLRKSINTQANA